MKKYLLSVLMLVITQFSIAQSIGIGTTNPDPKTMLDISSSSKGVLLPRMTSSQRISIINPPNGLLVYDSDQNELHQFDGVTWRAVLNSDYWLRPISTRNRIRTLDSIGIGISTPVERLDVNGNIRSRGDLLADGKLTATGIVTGSTFQTSGNLAVAGIGYIAGNISSNANLSIGGSSTLSGNITTEGDVIIKNTGAMMQLRNTANENKGFFQLSGDDLRLGTNSGNTAGDVILRLDGNDRFRFDKNGRVTLQADATPTIYLATGGVNQAYMQVQGENLVINATSNQVRIGNVLNADDASNRVGIGTTAPTERLHVSGNIAVTGKIASPTTGSGNNLLPTAYGRVSAGGSKISGTDNFTSANRVSQGTYNIFVTGLNANSIVIVNGEFVNSTGVRYMGADWFRIDMWDPRVEGWVNQSFSFVVYNP